MSTLEDMAAEVKVAQATLTGVASITPLERSSRLSSATGCDVYLKREDLQPVRSYKLRGAYNLMSQLSESERACGVICASAGNHGQGVAWSCARLGIDARIFIPSTTPRQKRDRMRALGMGHVELVVGGETYDEAADLAKAAVELDGATLVPAFDDLRTIAGQGTVAAEIVRQLGRAPDSLIIPVGGGGMLAGCLAWMKTHHPETRIVGVEPDGAACMGEAIERGGPITLPHIDTFVDGAAVRRAGDLTYDLVSQGEVELLTVPEGQICTEMLDLYQVDGIIAEPAGALASSVLPTSPVDEQINVDRGQTLVAIVSGGNNDVSRYSEIVELSLIHQGRKHYFLVQFPQEPGALRRFLDEVLGAEDDITHFEYVKRSNREMGPALIGIELGDPYTYPALLQRMAEGSIQFEIIGPDSPMLRFLI